MKFNRPLYRLKTLTVFIIVDEDGDEGIPAIPGPGGMLMPMIAGDEIRVTQLLKVAEGLVASGQWNRVKVLQFTDGKFLCEFGQPSQQ